ncbi:MAG: hypothetical protein E7261_05030 [Lachnospiraceae bacterium]|nr:hypothetical protein [Lachnospiraceae bacterium]
MSDAFGKIVGFMLASVLLFIVPLTFYAGRQQNLTQLYIINESMQFIESVKNTGVITEEIYRGFEDSVYGVSGRYKIELSRIHYEYNMDKVGDYVKTEKVYYLPQLEEEMEENGQIEFLEGDYVYLRVTRIGKGLIECMSDCCMLGNIVPENEVISFYGGYVKNESY